MMDTHVFTAKGEGNDGVLGARIESRRGPRRSGNKVVDVGMFPYSSPLYHDPCSEDGASVILLKEFILTL